MESSNRHQKEERGQIDIGGGFENEEMAYSGVKRKNAPGAKQFKTGKALRSNAFGRMTDKRASKN